jgi:hypothetical protein
MEIEYKIELYYRSDRLEDVLLKLPKLAHPSEEAMRDLRGNNIPDICRFRLCLRQATPTGSLLNCKPLTVTSRIDPARCHGVIRDRQ